MDLNKNQYGLILPKKTGVITPVLKKPAVFDSDSDEEPNSINWMAETVKKEKFGSGKNRQVKADIDRVLKDDPTAYQYDEIYDEMKKKNDEIEAVKKNDKKPKYMGLLLKQAERRKREDERRKERQIQKEREAEGDEFADKEVFVTSSYKKKLEEIRKMDEEDKRMERLEEIGDVTKQCDLGGFYRHLYESMTTTDALNSETNPTSQASGSDAKFRDFDKKKARNIRKRVTSDDENDSGSEQVLDKKRKPSNSEKVDSKVAKSAVSQVEIIQPKVSSIESKLEDHGKEIKIEPRDNDESDKDKDDHEEDADDKKDTNKAEIKPNITDDIDLIDIQRKMAPERRTDVWVKRTVGEVFDAALQRYKERKANLMAVY